MKKIFIALATLFITNACNTASKDGTKFEGKIPLNDSIQLTWVKKDGRYSPVERIKVVISDDDTIVACLSNDISVRQSALLRYKNKYPDSDKKTFSVSGWYHNSIPEIEFVTVR